MLHILIEWISCVEGQGNPFTYDHGYHGEMSGYRIRYNHKYQ